MEGIRAASDAATWDFVISKFQQNTDLPLELRTRFVGHLEQWRRDYEQTYQGAPAVALPAGASHLTAAQRLLLGVAAAAALGACVLYDYVALLR